MTTFAARLAEERPDEIAVSDATKTLNWQQTDEVLNRAVNALLKLDLGPERRMAVFAENSVETALANLAGLLAGISVVPVNFHLTAEEVAYILNDSEARVLFVDAATAERGQEAAASSGVHTVIGWGGARGDGLEDWAAWLEASEPVDPPTDMAPQPNLLYTSGTTGRPKGTPLPPTMFAGGATVAEHLERMA
ncbi:MAG: AMP-binding protein, partial [Pseudomonadota bacterium]